jgi:hypothetical protein
VELTEYSVSSVTEGIEALANTRIVVRPAGKMAGEGFVTSRQARPRRPTSGQARAAQSRRGRAGAAGDAAWAVRLTARALHH